MTKPEKTKTKLQKILTVYLREIHEIYTEGNFREESFYSCLKKLFEDCLQSFSSDEKYVFYQRRQKWEFLTSSFVKTERL